MLLLFVADAIIASEGVVNRRGRGKSERIKEEEEERGENSCHVGGRPDLRGWRLQI